jgi:GNAT superfamily N-acetyltransferase
MSTISNGPGAPLHPFHDAVATELRGWFIHSAPEINYHVTKHWFGYLSNHDGPIGARLILTEDDPSRVAALLKEAWEMSDRQKLSVWVDDRARGRNFDTALRSSGCNSVRATSHLALVGPVRAATGPATLTLDAVITGDLEEWSVTKIQCFDDCDDAPAPDRLASELAVRESERALGSLRLIRLDNEPVGVLGYYGGVDQLVYNLGTRVAFRHRGIAQATLATWVEEAPADCRSLMINATEGGRPDQLYRSLGFTDEVYWYQQYDFNGPVT